MNKKNFFKVLGLMMIFLLTGMVGFAQSDLPTFDLNGNVRSCEGTSIKVWKRSRSWNFPVRVSCLR